MLFHYEFPIDLKKYHIQVVLWLPSCQQGAPWHDFCKQSLTWLPIYSELFLTAFSLLVAWPIVFEIFFFVVIKVFKFWQIWYFRPQFKTFVLLSSLFFPLSVSVYLVRRTCDSKLHWSQVFSSLSISKPRLMHSVRIHNWIIPLWEGGGASTGWEEWVEVIRCVGEWRKTGLVELLLVGHGRQFLFFAMRLFWFCYAWGNSLSSSFEDLRSMFCKNENCKF